MMYEELNPHLRPGPPSWGRDYWVRTALRSLLGALLGILLVLVIAA
jgi:hypothetical protein